MSSKFCKSNIINFIKCITYFSVEFFNFCVWVFCLFLAYLYISNMHARKNPNPNPNPNPNSVTNISLAYNAIDINSKNVRSFPKQKFKSGDTLLTLLAGARKSNDWMENCRNISTSILCSNVKGQYFDGKIGFCSKQLPLKKFVYCAIRKQSVNDCKCKNINDVNCASKCGSKTSDWNNFTAENISYTCHGDIKNTHSVCDVNIFKLSSKDSSNNKLLIYGSGCSWKGVTYYAPINRINPGKLALNKIWAISNNCD